MKPIARICIVFVLFLYPLISHGQFSGKQREEFMITGMSTAKQTWWYFSKRLESPLQNQRFFRVYIMQLDVWLKDIHKTSKNKYTGAIDRTISGETELDTFTFEPEEIADWTVVDDDVLVGGFWLRLQKNTTLMKFKEAAKCDIVIQNAVSEDFVISSKEYPRDMSDNTVPENYDVDSAMNARYPGGSKALSELVSYYLSYPEYCHAFRLEGWCYAEFIINTDGTISNVKIKKSIGGGTNEIVRFIIRNMAVLKPSGDDTRIRFTMPICFKLQ